MFISWQPESKFPFAQVRLPMKDETKPEFQDNQEIEVYSRANDQEACGWWKAIIKVFYIQINLFKILFILLYVTIHNNTYICIISQ